MKISKLSVKESTHIYAGITQEKNPQELQFPTECVPNHCRKILLQP